MSTQAIRTAPRSRWQNAYVERVIGSIRPECFDHIIVMNAAGLSPVITEYMTYYMHSRTHLALGKDTPITRPVSAHRAADYVECRADGKRLWRDQGEKLRAVPPAPARWVQLQHPCHALASRFWPTRATA